MESWACFEVHTPLLFFLSLVADVCKIKQVCKMRATGFCQNWKPYLPSSSSNTCLHTVQQLPLLHILGVLFKNPMAPFPRTQRCSVCCRELQGEHSAMSLWMQQRLSSLQVLLKRGKKIPVVNTINPHPHKGNLKKNIEDSSNERILHVFLLLVLFS